MELMFVLTKCLRLLCCFAAMLFVNGCYSHFAIEENDLTEIIRKNKISRIQLKDGTELNMTNGENVLISVESDSLTVKNTQGDFRKIALTDIAQWFEYKFNFIRTLIGTAVITATIYFLFIGTYIHFVPPP
ncbi:MAG: hypothetical protein AB1775_00245 [Bacteroidota bacterium]